MKFFFSITVILTVISSLVVAEETIEQQIASAERAMDNNLWDVASSKLKIASEISDLTPETRAKILILLAESKIRGNRPSKALELLEQKSLADLEETTFWRGQALAGLGRFADASELLEEIAKKPTHPYFREAALTAASLQLSLGKPEQSLSILQLLQTSPKPSDQIESAFHQMEILIDLGRFEEARALFPDREKVPKKLIPTSKFLEATLTLAEGNPAQAETIFQELQSNPQGISINRFNLAAIGKADALAAQGKPDIATQSLLTFIQDHSETALLEPIFRRIIHWLPEQIITTDHPTLTRLQEWLPITSPPSSGLINTEPASAAAAWPVISPEISDVAVFAMHARAIGLHRIDSPNTKEEARQLLQKILLFAPRHFLAPRALLALAKWHLDENESDQAFALFDSLRQTAKSTLIKGEAAFFDAKIAFEQGEKELAITLFDEAASLLSNQNREVAILNSALIRLNESNPDSLVIKNDDPEISKRLNTELDLEKALSNPDPEQAKIFLDQFLKNHPQHPRATEARLKIIDAALALTPPDLSLARAQLDTIQAEQLTLDPEQSARLSINRLRLLDALNQTEPTIALAKEIIAQHPATPAEAQASLILGKSLFNSGNYNDARLIFEKLANTQPGTQRSQAALLLAARSAALGATAQSRQEALTLFDQTIDIDGPLRSLAILEKARLNIDLNRIDIAIESLTEAYQEISPDDPSRLPTGLLLAEAIYAKGDSKPESLTKALEIYNQLIQLSITNPSQYFRLQYLRGLTLEKLPDPDQPGSTRLGDALSAYYAVLDRPVDPPPPEFEWFERSGFRALTLLENAERWQAAISIAEKIASFGGPRAEEAATRARQLRLKHMIWED